jgi:hypothetical protein
MMKECRKVTSCNAHAKTSNVLKMRRVFTQSLHACVLSGARSVFVFNTRTGKLIKS